MFHAQQGLKRCYSSPKKDNREISMNSTPSHKSPHPDELLPWFVDHMRSLGEEDATDNHASPRATDLQDSCILSEDEAAGQGSLNSVTDAATE